MRAIVEIFHSQTRDALPVGQANDASIDVARDVIAGSILQIAYVAMKLPAARPSQLLRRSRPSCGVFGEGE